MKNEPRILRILMWMCWFALALDLKAGDRTENPEIGLA
jgi:hypothetical protein